MIGGENENENKNKCYVTFTETLQALQKNMYNTKLFFLNKSSIELENWAHECEIDEKSNIWQLSSSIEHIQYISHRIYHELAPTQ